MLMIVAPSYRYARHIEKRLKYEGFDAKATTAERLLMECQGKHPDPTILVVGEEAFDIRAERTLHEVTRMLGLTTIPYEEPRCEPTSARSSTP